MATLSDMVSARLDMARAQHEDATINLIRRAQRVVSAPDEYTPEALRLASRILERAAFGRNVRALATQVTILASRNRWENPEQANDGKREPG